MLEPEHRRVVRARLAALLGLKPERVEPSLALVRLARDPRRLGEAVQRLQQEFGVALDGRALATARTVDHLVTLVSDAARLAQAAAAAPEVPPLPAEPAPAVPTGPASPRSTPRGETFTSSIGFETERIHAVALHCSDGRIGDHVDDFLHNGLGLPRYDRLACPGGPAALAGRLLAFWESRGVEDQLRFLLRFHAIRQVVLVAHQPCAYYAERLGIAPAAVEEEQEKDLRLATWAVKRADPDLEVGSFVARVHGGRVAFEKLHATEALAERARRWGREDARS